MGKKGEKGQVTVFISLITLCMFALFCGLLESARTAGARWYLQTASASALDSVFSQYHRQLWDSYRLLFAEYEDENELEADFTYYFQPYQENSGWYPMEQQTINVEEFLTVTDDNGTYLEQEISDYMIYGIWKMDFDADSVDGLWDDSQEAEAVQEVAEQYRDHAKKALNLERSLEAISKSQQNQLAKKNEGLACLKRYDGPGFRRCAKDLIKELKRMPGLVDRYRLQADKLAKELAESRTLFEEKQGECSSAVSGQMDEEIQQFEAYISQDGQRRREIEALAPQSVQQIELVEKAIEEAEEVEETIEQWESDDEDDDEPDLDALWRPVIKLFNQLTITPLSFSHGVKDEEKEGWLNQITELYRSGLLSLVLPERAEVSRGLLETPELPSQHEIMAKETRTVPLLSHLIINEYCGRFFRHFPTGTDAQQSSDIQAGGKNTQTSVKIAETDNKNMKETSEDKLTEQNVGVPGTGGLAYEIEYLLNGKDTDEENLAAVINQLITIREGLNLIHILSDSTKRHAAEELAAVITGIAGLSPLVLLTTFFIMSIWALGESLMDIRNLLAGKRVAIVKTASDWSLGLENLLTLGREGQMDSKGGEKGLTYLSWLKILLLMSETIKQEYRMMDMIQMNICRKQPSFRMRRGVYQVKLSNQVKAKHVFLSLGLVENIMGNGDNQYPMSIKIERTY